MSAQRVLTAEQREAVMKEVSRRVGEDMQTSMLGAARGNNLWDILVTDALVRIADALEEGNKIGAPMSRVAGRLQDLTDAVKRATSFLGGR